MAYIRWRKTFRQPQTKVDEDVREASKILGIRNWQRYAIDREAWRSNTQEAKARYQAVAPCKKNKNKKRLQREARYFLPQELRLAVPSIVQYGILGQIILYHYTVRLERRCALIKGVEVMSTHHSE
jgi:hypothetical protein